MVAVSRTLIQFQQPDKYALDMSRNTQGKTLHMLAFSDGTHRYLYMPAQAQYRTVPAGSDQALTYWEYLKTVPPGKVTHTLLDSKPALLYSQAQTLSGKPYMMFRAWADPKTHLLRRVSRSYVGGTKPQTMYQATLTDWKINPAIPPARFAFVPPAGAKEAPSEDSSGRPALLANGTLAPDFAVQDRKGKPVHLSDYKGKVVVLDFWSTWCGPCQASLPHTQDVAAKFAPQGVVVLAVNVWDTRPAYDTWLPQHAQYRNIAFAFDPSEGSKAVTADYHVSGIPTQYIIGKDGKITQSFVGYGGPTDDLANALTSALKE